MSIEVEKATVACCVCGANVIELRRGRCWSCYMQWADLRPVGTGATCTVCHERRRDFLRLVEVHNRSVPLCHGCAVRTIKLQQVPPTLHGLRAALRRDRRGDNRREDALDGRIFPRERRVGERRVPMRSDGATPLLDLHAIDLALDELEVAIEIDDADIEILETTQVRDAPQSEPR